MTTTLCPDHEIALFSETGEHWFDDQAPDQQRPFTWDANDAVTKMVIGTPPSGGEEQQIAVSIPADLSALYKNLTHLHLWQISDLEQLPKLPNGLLCLDVRGCEQLRSLPSLPDTVEDLDVAGCKQLAQLSNAPKSLRRLYLNGCIALEEDLLSAFWLELARIQADSHLAEFEAARCPAVTSLRRIPRSVTRLVLQGCENLRDVRNLHEFPQLRHLNLSDCSSVKDIPGVPDRLQYVQLHGSDQLKQFMGQDIGPFDRGTAERPNVAKTLYSRRKFGNELTTSAHAKLLLLGDGRVGKSTLAKRLQWDCLSAGQQADPQFAHLKPRVDEKFTHKVRFSLWKTPLRLNEETANRLNEQAASAGVPVPPCRDDHSIDGSIRIWDFGGQEIYHQTHRLFVAEGSVFLILWMEKEVDWDQLLKEKPKHGITDDEWREWNRARSLDYWIDYVRSMRRNAKIALVCTRVPNGQPHPPWTARAPKHGQEDLRCFYIDSLEHACPANPDYQKLVDFIRQACGAEASRIGILQPTYYSEVADYVDELLQENDQARHDPMKKPKHLSVPAAAWQQDLVRRHATSGRSEHELDADDVGTITGYLHDAGNIFQLGDPSNPAILIDQEWATDLIYKILRPTDDEEFSLFNVIRAGGGYFDASVLVGDSQWQSLRSDAERQQILSFMEQCGIIVRLLSRRDSRDAKDHYLATEKWLLPEYAGELEQRCESIFRRVQSRAEGSLHEDFSFQQHPINEFQFRTLMAHLGNLLGTRATWFRNGLQAVDDLHDPAWCFQVRWRPSDAAGFFGDVIASLTTAPANLDDLAGQVETVFASDASPFARHMKSLHRETRSPDDPAHCIFRDVKDSDFDVAISSSGADETIVRPLVDALKAAGIRVLWYRLPECRIEEMAKVKQFMDALRQPPCILLFLSDAYLKNDPENNWYCVWELADAILQLETGKRSERQTLVAYADGGHLSCKNLDSVAEEVMKSMGHHFRNLFNSKVDKDTSNRHTFNYYSDWSKHFYDAADRIGNFFHRRGTPGTFSTYKLTEDGQYDFSDIVREVNEVGKAGHGG
ncbi:MAG: TIR domain-containing protein [Planctomycetota bacterium]|nr:TIR domain-containing protein [Planctomycetota bacterium]